MLNEIVNQAEAASRLLERAQSAAGAVRGLRSGDRVYTPLVAAAEFQQGTAPSANLVFNVPADADFWAYRFMLYPYCRVIDPSGSSEITYRPTSFTSQPLSPGITADDEYSDFESQVDAEFAFIFDGREVQSTNIPAAAAYCVNVEKWSAPTSQLIFFHPPIWTGATQTPSGLVFDIPWFFPRGKTLTCRVTPTYLGVRTIDSRQHQYKIVGVLEGEKRPGAYR
jgi:hypothetical protein